MEFLPVAVARPSAPRAACSLFSGGLRNPSNFEASKAHLAFQQLLLRTARVHHVPHACRGMNPRYMGSIILCRGVNPCSKGSMVL